MASASSSSLSSNSRDVENESDDRLQYNKEIQEGMMQVDHATRTSCPKDTVEASDSARKARHEAKQARKVQETAIQATHDPMKTPGDETKSTNALCEIEKSMKTADEAKKAPDEESIAIKNPDEAMELAKTTSNVANAMNTPDEAMTSTRVTSDKTNAMKRQDKAMTLTKSTSGVAKPVKTENVAIKLTKAPCDAAKAMQIRDEAMELTKAKSDAAKASSKPTEIMKGLVEAKKTPDETFNSTDDAQEKSLKVKKAPNEASKAPDEARDATRKRPSIAKPSDISRILEGSKEMYVHSQTDEAKRLAFRAMLGASEAMDEFLESESDGTPCNISQKQLYEWFSKCAFLFEKMGADIQALRCFYTGRLFVTNWNETMQMQASEDAWIRLFNPPLQANVDKIYDLLEKMLDLAKTAVKRRQYHVASFLTYKLGMTYQDLILRRKLGRRSAILPKPEQKFYEVMKPVYLLQIRCKYHLLHQREVNW